MSESASYSRMASDAGGRIKVVDGLSAARVCGDSVMRDDIGGLVSGAGASMCGGGEEEDVGETAKEAVDACALSTRLSIDGGGGERDGEGPCVAGGGGPEAAVWCVEDSTVTGIGGGASLDMDGGVGVTGSGTVGGTDDRGVKGVWVGVTVAIVANAVGCVCVALGVGGGGGTSSRCAAAGEGDDFDVESVVAVGFSP